MLDGPGGNSCKLEKFLHSEVNVLIKHIIVQDEDGQNNNNIHIYDRGLVIFVIALLN